MDLAQDDEWLYVRTEKEIVRVSKDRSGVEQSLVTVTASNGSQGRGTIAVHRGTVYWGKSDGTIWRKRANEAPELFLDSRAGARDPNHLTVANDVLYFLHDAQLSAINLTSSNAYPGLATADGFVADADAYYFMRERSAPTEELWISAATLGESRHWDTWLPARTNLGSVQVEGRFVYYISELEGCALRRREKFGQLDELVTKSDALNEDVDYAVVGDDVYWSFYDGSLYHLKIGEGTEPELISRQFGYDDDNYEGLLLVDADYVYWEARVDTTLLDDRDPLPIIRTCRAVSNR